MYRPPLAELKEYINGFVNLEGDEKETDGIPIYPNTCSYLTYSYLNSATFEKEDKKHQLPKLFASGLVTEKDLHLSINDKIGHLGIEFKPAGFYKLFRFNMSILLNDFADFSSIDNSYDHLLENLEASDTFEKRCDILEEYLLQKLLTAAKVERIDQCITLLEEDPAVKIKDLCISAAISERQLRRKFKQIIGLSPKSYGKVQQIKQVFLLIDQNKKELLKEYAYKCGYYDVSHFIHAFQNEIGRNPSEFIEGYDDYLSFYLSNKR